MLPPKTINIIPHNEPRQTDTARTPCTNHDVAKQTHKKYKQTIGSQQIKHLLNARNAIIELKAKYHLPKKEAKLNE